MNFSGYQKSRAHALILPANPHMKPSISAYLATIGRKGGQTTGPSKARTAEQARKAGLASAAARRRKKQV